MPDFVWIQEVVFPIFGMGGVVFLLFGVYRTVNRALDRRHERAMGGSGGAGGASREEIERLASRIEALEESTERVQELEERMDFTERVLTQQ